MTGYSDLYSDLYSAYADTGGAGGGGEGIYSDTYSDFYGLAGPPDTGGGGGGGGTEGGFLGWGPSWGEPFYGGAATAITSVPWPCPVAIAGHGYSLDLKSYDRQTVNVFREARDSQAQPGEGTLNPQGAWKRTRDDWSLGFRQVWPDRDQADPRRFNSSKGIDVWTFNQFSLLPDTERYRDATTISKLELLPVGPYLYSVEDANLLFTLNPTDPTPDYTTVTFAANIVDITTDGNRIYAAIEGIGIRYVTVGDTTILGLGGAADTQLCDIIQYANGWLFGALNQDLFTIAADGAKAVIMTHPVVGYKWVAVTGTPSFIYAGGQAQDNAEIYSTNTDNTGALTFPQYAGTLVRGEILRSMVYYGSIVMLCTSKGLHAATISTSVTRVGNGSLAEGPLVPIGDVRCVWGEDKFVYFGWSNYDLTSTGIGRVNLAEFTNIQTPACASDVMYTGQGVVQTVVRMNGKTFFGVANDGYVRSMDDLVKQGSIDLGRFRWGTFEPKVFLGAEVVHEPLGGAIAVTITADDGKQFDIGSRVSQGTTGTGEVLGVNNTNQISDWFEPTLIVARSTLRPSVGPTVLRVTMRALPVPKQVEQFTIPIILTDMVDLGNGEQSREYNTRVEYEFLRKIQNDGIPVTYQEGPKSYMVTIRQVEWTQGQVNNWNRLRDGMQGILTVTAITTEV